MNVDDAIKAVELAVQDLKTSIVDLEVAAESEFGMSPPHAILALKQRASEIVLGKVRVDVAELRRPKGPPVTLEYVGYFGRDRDTKTGEVIRRTKTQLVVRDHHGSVSEYSMKDGEPPGGKKTHATRVRGYRTGTARWRVVKSELARFESMSIGENDVSRALNAITAGDDR